MSMSNFSIVKPSNKKFGFLISFAILFLTAYFYYFTGKLSYSLIIIMLVLILLTFTKPHLLEIPNRLWMKLGYFLGLIVSPIIMFLIFILAFCSIGLILKILNKDFLDTKIDKSKRTYWNLPDLKTGNMKDQF